MYKRIKKKLILLALVIMIAAFPRVETDAKKSTQDKLNDAKNDKDNLKDSLEDTKDKIDDLNTEIGGLLSKLSELDSELIAVSERLEYLETEIATKEAQILVTEAELNEAQNQRDVQYQEMKDRIQFIYERGETAYLEVLFGATSFSEFVTRANYISKLEAYDRSMLEIYRETCGMIEEVKATLETEAAELDALQAEAESEKAKIEDIIAETSNYITIYEDQVEEAERLAKQYEKEIKEKESDIKYLEKKLKEEEYLAKLAEAAITRDLSCVKFDEGDRYLLANLIYCEAGGEIYAGKLAVGAVVINRLLNGAFPNTITGVIYQKNQFSPAGSGRLALALAQNRATKSCYTAADEAMSGVTNVGGCLFFRTPHPSKTPKYIIGGHIFY